MSVDDSSKSSIAASQALYRFGLVAGLILFIRLVSLWFNNSELFFDEAQYWVWGNEPAFGYFSKPPLLAWIIGSTTAICGDSEFCVRLPSALFHTLTGFVIFMITQRLFSAKVALTAGIMWLLIPAVSLSSTLISTDVPLLLCWALALYALMRMGEGGWGFALLFAFTLGMGLNAKYAMGFFVLCAIFWSLISSEGRKTVLSTQFWLALFIGFAMLVPNIIWNFENHFATVSHTGDNIGWGGGFPHLDRLAEFVASQFGVVGPIVFAVYLIALFRLSAEGLNEKHKFLIAFSLPVLVLICFQAIMSKAFANWAATAFPAVIILVADLFVNRMPPYWKRISNGIHMVVFAILSVAVAFAAPGQLPLPAKQNPFERMWGGKELASAIESELGKSEFDYVLSPSRKWSATLIYYLRGMNIDVIAWRKSPTPSDHFELTRALQDMDREIVSKATFIFPTFSTVLSEQISDQFQSVSKLTELKEYQGSDKEISLFALQGFKGQAQ